MKSLPIVGLIPAAGLATRLQPLPLSKELFPVGFEYCTLKTSKHPKAVMTYLLEQMQQGGAEQAYIILREGKWDIPAYYGDGSKLNMSFAYLIMQKPYGTPFTLDQAFSFVRNKTVLFGFPDILIRQQSVFKSLLHVQQETAADVVLGIFRATETYKWDMVDVDENGVIKNITPKPNNTNLLFAWSVACWSPRFTEFMHNFLGHEYSKIINQNKKKEYSVGEVIQAAIASGLLVQSVKLDADSCLDIGTSGDLRKAILEFL
jgi:dTDP-glucose pyrophosphorylase